MAKTKTQQVKEVEPVKVQKTEAKVQREKKPKRSFKAIYTSPTGEVVMGGRYCGAKPKQAGCKALAGIYKLFAGANKKLKGEIYFGVKETTRGGRGKTYYYSGERVVLDKPINLQIGGGDGSAIKTITYRFNSNVKKASEEDCAHLANPKEIVNPVEQKEIEAAIAPKKQSKKNAKVVEEKEEPPVIVETKIEKKTEKKADKKKPAKK